MNQRSSARIYKPDNARLVFASECCKTEHGSKAISFFKYEINEADFLIVKNEVQWEGS
jgi:hypothetical protein